LWNELRQSIPSSFFRYFEPFLGGGALFFALRPPDAILGDKNEELIVTYTAIRDDLSAVIPSLRQHQRKHSTEYFYKVRDLVPADLPPAKRAARLIYLNKTCFNGLYRVNSRGEFNVPIGQYKNPLICDERTLRAASECLKGRTILPPCDYSQSVAEAKKHDFIYFDPPYHPISDTSSFTGYQPNGFGEDEQRKLADKFFELSSSGCYVLLSNSAAPLIYELYGNRKGISVREVRANRAINSKSERRGKILELLISNY
jgi:DNA adenine methylase